MAFDDLSSDRAQGLITSLVEQMNPERYASFLAWSTFGDSGIMLVGVGTTPDKPLDGWNGRVEKADLFELQECGYVRIDRDHQGTLHGGLMKRARDEYARSRPAASPTDRSDVFISHAGEDKNDVARPLADELRRRGFKVWYDEYVLRLGDSLPKKIDEGLGSCRYGVVILSPSFFAKNWPRRELDGLAAREVIGGKKVILPVWHNVDQAQVAKFSPTLASKLAVSTQRGIPAVVDEIVTVLHEDQASAVSARRSDAEAAREGGRPFGDDLADAAVAELRSIATKRDREAVLDAKACLLLDLCFQAFAGRVTQRKDEQVLHGSSSVRKRTDGGGVFALEYQSSYRFPSSGSCAFGYELWASDRRAQVAGWLQVEVPSQDGGDPLLVIRWLSTAPPREAERVLQQGAGALREGPSLEEVQGLVDQLMARVFGRVMGQLAELAKQRA